MKNDDIEDGVFELYDPAKKSKTDTEAEQHDLDSLYDLIGTLGNDSTISVTIDKQAKNGKFDLVDVYPSSEVNLELINHLRDELGPGNYRFKAKRRGDRHPLWVNMYTFTKRPYADTPAPQIPQVNLAPIMEQLRQQNELMLKLFERQQQQQQPREDQEEILLRRMAMYKQLFANDHRRDDNGLDTLVKTIGVVKDLVQPDSGSNMLDVVRDVVKSMSTISAQQKSLPQQIIPPMQHTIKPAPSQGSNRSTEANIMKNYFSQILDYADAGRDTLSLAEQLVNWVDNENLVQLLEQEGLIEIIEASDVRAIKHREWIKSLIGHLENLLYETDDDQNESIKEVDLSKEIKSE